jgi:hypothetical protein
MHDLMKKKFSLLAADTPNIDGSTAVGEFIFPNPVIITKVGYIVTTAVVADGTENMDFDLSRRPVVGSSSNAVALAQFRAQAANVDTAAGDVVWVHTNVLDTDGETAEDGTTRYEAPNANITAPETRRNPWLILPGQSFAMTLQTDAEADSGAVRGFVEYIDLPWNDGFVDQTNVIEGTILAAA